MGSNAKNLSALKDMIDDESKFKAIVERFRGEKIYFTGYGEFCTKEERDQAVYDDFRKGMNVVEIADKYEISTSLVYKICEQYCYS